MGNAPLVLVVEDFDDARDLSCEYLSFVGYRVASATNGHEALDRAGTLLPDVILMDLSLPGIDGWEVARRLKASSRTRHIPIVAVSGHVLAGSAERAAEAGCDAFVAKPCMPDRMVDEIRRVLGTADRQRS